MKQQKFDPIGSLIKVGKRPETTLSLLKVIKEENADGTVGTYVFTDSIRGHFISILESVATGKGQGFWVNAEMGAGKTHFLAVLTLLLSSRKPDIWENVHDNEIGNYSKRLSNVKLFPVVLSLRGESGEEHTEKALLEIIQDAIARALQAHGLKEDIMVTSAEEIVSWFNNLGDEFKNPIKDHIQRKTKASPEQILKQAGRKKLARLIWDVCQEHGFRIDIPTSTKDRIAAIYDQLCARGKNGYNGLLFVIDEFAFWQDMHPEGSPQYARDEEVLETLAFVLPKDMHYNIYTVVASQKHVPTKLWGSGSGDRFINLVLMRDGGEREYDIIVSRRVRELNTEKEPEINGYYEYYAHNFDFMKDIDEELFRDIFPFQPRCFDVLRQITARNLPTARVGINVLHEVIDPESPHNKDETLSVLLRDQLVTVADLMLSNDLTAGLSTAPSYREAYDAYETAIRNLGKIPLEDDQKDLAERIIKTLFLLHCASPDVDSPISVHELAQATLTAYGKVKPDDEVAVILSKLQDLAQVSYSRDKAEAAFRVHRTGPEALEVFNELKQKIVDPYEIDRLWRESLNKPATDLKGQSAIFAQMVLTGVPNRTVQETSKVEYTGETVLCEKWQPQWGESIFKDDHHFRVVMVMEKTDIPDGEIKDDRIAVCVPGDLSSEATEAVKSFGAIQRMEQLYKEKKEKDAEQIREWIYSRKADISRDLINSQYSIYRAGRIYTKSRLSIDPGEVFATQEERRRLECITIPLLNNAYSKLPKSFQAFKRTFAQADAFKVLAGFFNQNPKPAERSAVENFAVGLELSKPENPRKFSPAPPFVFEYLKQCLDNNQGHINTWKVYQELSNPPYGLTYPLTTLYILCFILQSSPPIELYLKPTHNVVLKASNQKPRDNRITSDIIPKVDWKVGVWQHFDTLNLSSGPSWNDIVPFARLLSPDFTATTDLDEIERHEDKLLDCTKSICDETDKIENNVKLLASKLEQQIAGDDKDALQRIREVVDCTDCTTFYKNLQAKYTQPEPFGSDLSTYKNWKAISDHSTEIIHVEDWLKQASIPESEQQLRIDNAATSNQLVISSLLKNPPLWPSIRANFDRFKTSYRNKYQAFHRDHFKRMAELRKRRDVIAQQLEALQKLNKIEELGKPAGTHLANEFQNLDKRLSTCPITSVTQVSVENQPFCAGCNLKFGDSLPVEDISYLDKEVDKALREQMRRFASGVVRQILAKRANDKLTKFLQIVQGSNIAPLVDVLDDDLINYIREFLAAEGVRTEPTLILRSLKDQFPVVEEEKLESVVQEFRKLLQSAFVEAKKHNPGKRVTISLE